MSFFTCFIDFSHYRCIYVDRCFLPHIRDRSFQQKDDCNIFLTQTTAIKMKLSIVQKDIQNNDYYDFLEHLSDSDTDVVLFGELATTGCLYNGMENRKIEPVETLSEKFQKYSFSILLGTPRIANNKLYNSYISFGKSDVQIYDKVNLFEPMNEVEHFTAGEKPVLFDIDGKKIGVSICYDVRFPNHYDILKEMGADIIIIPAAFPRIRIDAWKELLIERAVQTKLTVVGINAVGDDGTNEFGGSSMVVAPDGSLIAQADEINETIIEVEL